MRDFDSWLENILRRLPLTKPGTLVASQEGIGVFLGNWLGGNRSYGVKRGNRVFVEMYPSGEKVEAEPVSLDWLVKRERR